MRRFDAKRGPQPGEHEVTPQIKEPTVVFVSCVWNAPPENAVMATLITRGLLNGLSSYVKFEPVRVPMQGIYSPLPPSSSEPG